MKMNDFVEVSAIVTHPEHTGKGYAKQLITYVVNKILDQQKTPLFTCGRNKRGCDQPVPETGFSNKAKDQLLEPGEQPVKLPDTVSAKNRNETARPSNLSSKIIQKPATLLH